MDEDENDEEGEGAEDSESNQQNGTTSNRESIDPLLGRQVTSEEQLIMRTED
jgi:hypothetical protein